ncbi:hypothetical protein Tco_1038096 [Tanacetum coccineum]
MYYASVLEIAVLFCFFEDQLSNLSPKNCALPEIAVALFALWRTSWSNLSPQDLMQAEVLLPSILTPTLDPLLL